MWGASHGRSRCRSRPDRLDSVAIDALDCQQLGDAGANNLPRWRHAMRCPLWVAAKLRSQYYRLIYYDDELEFGRLRSEEGLSIRFKGA
jgi:hypothetical protein